MKSGNQDINIRFANEGDMEKVRDIYNQSIALGYVTADREPTDQESRLHFWKTITQTQQRPFWIAERNGLVIAFFYFRNYYDRPAYRITAEIGIYVDQSEHGKGTGKYILDYCCQKAPETGIENILALIFAANLPSIRLFEQAGFVLRGEFKNIAKADNGYNDLLIFQKSLV